MKKKNGFTFVELLATIALIGVLATISIISYSSIKSKVLEKQYKSLELKIVSVGKKYLFEREIKDVYVQSLVDEGLITTDNDGNILNPIDNSALNCHYVSVDDAVLHATESNTCEQGQIRDGSIRIKYCTTANCTNQEDFDENKWYNTEKMYIYASMTDEVREKKWVSQLNPGSPYPSEVFEITVDGSGYYRNELIAHMVASDNKNYSRSVDVKIDIKKPYIQSNECDDLENYTESKNIKLNICDDESGIKEAYILDSKKNKVATGEKSGSCYVIDTTITTNDLYSVYAVDNAGNELKPNCEINEDGCYKITTIYSNYTINYYLGNGTETFGGTNIGKSDCKTGMICKLKSFASFSKSLSLPNGKWTFAGWTTDSKKTNIEYEDQAQVILYNEDIKDKKVSLYVVGERDVTFSSGYEPRTLQATEKQYWNPYSSTDTAYITSINVPVPNTVSQWRFIGWRASDIASSQVLFNKSGVSYTLKAQYVPDFRGIYERDITVRYNSNGGSGVVPAEQQAKQYYNSGVGNSGTNKGSNVSTVDLTLGNNELTKTGYTADGWCYDQSCNQSYASGKAANVNHKYSSSSIITLYAKWKANELKFIDETKDSVYSTSTTEILITKAENGTGSYAYSITSQKNSSGTTVSYFSISSSKITVAASTPVGTYKLSIAAKDNNSGAVKSAIYTIEITKASSSVTTAPTAKTLTYTGSSQALLNAGTCSGGTIKYSADNSTYSTTITKGTGAGDYTVYYKCVGDSNHSNTTAKSITITIAKASSTTTCEAQSKTYNGSSQSASCTSSGTTSSAITYYTNSTCTTKVATSTGASASGGAPKDAGTYYIKASGTGDSNHNNSNSSCVKFTINPKSLSVSWGTTVQFDYDGNNHAPTASIDSTGVSGETITLSTTKDSTTGKHTSTASCSKVTGGRAKCANYTLTDTTKEYTIGKIPSSVTTVPKANTLTYTGSAQTLITKGTCTGGTIKYKVGSGGYSTTPPTATAAGSYTVYYKCFGDSTHNDTSDASVSVTISKASQTATAPTKKSLTYTGSAQALVTAGSCTGGTMNYKVDSGSYAKTVPTATKVGTYTISYKCVGDSNHKDTTEASVKSTISYPDATSTAPKANTLTYTGSAQALVAAGSCTGGTMNYKLGTGSYSATIPTATAAGSYTVNYKCVGDSTHNDSSEKNVSVTISKAAVKVTAPTALNPMYNGSAQTLIKAGSCTGGTLKYKLGTGSYTTTLPTATNVNTYTISYKCTGDSNHNDSSESSISASITKNIDTINGTRWNGCTEYYITTCDDTTCNYTKKNKVAETGTIDRSTLSPNPGSKCSRTYCDAYIGPSSSSDALFSTNVADYCKVTSVVRNIGICSISKKYYNGSGVEKGAHVSFSGVGTNSSCTFTMYFDDKVVLYLGSLYNYVSWKTYNCGNKRYCTGGCSATNTACTK